MQEFLKDKSESDVNGAFLIEFKIPGTFTTLDSKDPNFSGRTIIEAKVWMGNPKAGDSIGVMQYVDKDLKLQGLVKAGFLPAQVLAAFPNYPILGTWADPDALPENQGQFFEPSGATIITPPGGEAKLASEMYAVLTAQKGDNSVDTLYVDMTANATEPAVGTTVIQPDDGDGS